MRALFVLGVASILPCVAAAQTSLAPPPGPPPVTRRFQFSPYEQASIDGAMRALGLERETEPEGKTVESVHTVRLEVIEKRDWATAAWKAPRFLNVFHVVTREPVVLREALLAPGDAWVQTLADETQRNLAALPQLSLVLVLAAKGSTKDRVRLVIVTKDVWSIRLQWNIALTNGGLERLTINPAETNLLGTHQSLGVLYDYLPESSGLGASWSAPRLFGTRVAALAQANVILNNRTGSPEGTTGTVSVQKPLWSSLTEWAWGAGVGWTEQIARSYTNAHVARYSLDPKAACDAPSPTCVPWAYRSDLVTATADVTRSFGWVTKHDVTVGFEARRRRFCVDSSDCRDLDLSAYDPATVQAFKSARVPVSDDRVGPYFQYRTYTTNFVRVLDFESLALQEDYRLGYDAYARVYPIFGALGSSRDVVGFSTGLSYTLPVGWAGALPPVRDGVVRIGVQSVGEVDTSRQAVTDGSIEVNARVATPRTAAGRIVLDGVVLDRYENYLRRLSYLGGDTRLRGYPSRRFYGGSMASLNVEWRTRPLELFRSVEIGGVLFYDAGDAFDHWRSFDPKHGAGLGARVLFPQLDRVVFRVDVGFPLSYPLAAGVSPVAFFATFEQAFPMPGIDPRSAVTLN